MDQERSYCVTVSRVTSDRILKYIYIHITYANNEHFNELFIDLFILHLAQHNSIHTSNYQGSYIILGQGDGVGAGGGGGWSRGGDGAGPGGMGQGQGGWRITDRYCGTTVTGPETMG